MSSMAWMKDLTEAQCLSEFCFRRCDNDGSEKARSRCRREQRRMECPAVKVKDLRWLIRFVMRHGKREKKP